MKNNKQSLREMWDILKSTNTQPMGTPGDEEKKILKTDTRRNNG